MKLIGSHFEITRSKAPEPFIWKSLENLETAYREFVCDALIINETPEYYLAWFVPEGSEKMTAQEIISTLPVTEDICLSWERGPDDEVIVNVERIS